MKLIGPNLNRTQHLDCAKGADGHAAAAEDALLHLQLGGDRLLLDVVLRQKSAGLGGGGKALGQGFAHVFRALHGSGKEDPGRAGLGRAELRVLLQQEAVFATRDFKLLPTHLPTLV